MSWMRALAGLVEDSFFIAAFFIIFFAADRIIAATGFERLPGESQRRRAAV